MRKHRVYQPASEGPFRCDHCEYANAAARKCSHPEIIRLQKGVIEPGGCCDYFERDKERSRASLKGLEK